MSAQEHPITCHELLDFLHLDLEDGPEGRRSGFDRPLAVCDRRRAYSQYEDAIRVCKAAFGDPDGPAQADTPEELVQAILRTRRKA